MVSTGIENESTIFASPCFTNLASMVSDIKSMGKSQDIYSVIVTSLIKHFPFDIAILFQYEEQCFLPSAIHPDSHVCYWAIQDQDATKHLLNHDRPFYAEKSELNFYYQVPHELAEGIFSPFLLHDELPHVLFLGSIDKKKTWLRESLSLAESLTALIEMAIENTDLNQNIEQLELFAKENAELFQEMEQKVNDRTKELNGTLEALRKTQDQLIQSEKMAALGNLVAGVAHEINTPIGIGVTAVSHLEEKSRELQTLFELKQMKRSDLENYLALVNETISITLANLKRGSDLIKSFKQVAVDQTRTAVRWFSPKESLEELIISLRPNYKTKKIQFIIECEEDLKIYQEPGAFAQLMTNLIMNSVIHGFERQETGTISISIKDNAGMLEIIFSDNGKGMDEETRQKIFDPFFTTKRGDGGTGLGMHIVYNLVTQSFSGTISCKSEADTGAVFIIHMPVREGENNG